MKGLMRPTTHVSPSPRSLLGQLEKIEAEITPIPDLSQFLDVLRYDITNTGLSNNVMMRLLAFTGLRRSELVALTWPEIGQTEMTAGRNSLYAEDKPVFDQKLAVTVQTDEGLPQFDAGQIPSSHRIVDKIAAPIDNVDNDEAERRLCQQIFDALQAEQPVT